MTTTGFSTIAEIKAANKAAGLFFFEPATLRFFRSQVGKTVYRGKYFVTSEQFVDSRGTAHQRRYTIRIAKPDGDIDTVGKFQAYDSAAEARAAIKALDEETTD